MQSNLVLMAHYLLLTVILHQVVILWCLMLIVAKYFLQEIIQMEAIKIIIIR
jgi:hypothetical protein